MEAKIARRAHAMPFGTEILADGVLFRLWAPGALSVDLALEQEDGDCILTPMARTGNGWYRLVSPQAAAGSAYRFRIDGRLLVPDPVSRSQLADVHGPSVVVDPRAFPWRDSSWRGRPWEEAVVYELHTGAFSPEGDFSGVTGRLDDLAGLGVTAVQLLPVADFTGRRNWGYDGALLFAPDRIYGSPEDLKVLVQEAHARNLMVILDVVCNHFGPEGNYLHVYAGSAFFDARRQTPWGAALNLDGEMSATVRRFIVDNVLYWLEEFHLDGLRFDAVHAIIDDSATHILEEIARAIRDGPGRHRHIHLILENDDNQSRYLQECQGSVSRLYDAQWNDDFHHCCHVLLTGERDGYYRDYACHPLQLLGRCLTEGFAYQGEVSGYRSYRPRGERSSHLPPAAFVCFLQNHDQIGNRAFGERLGHLVAERQLLVATVLLLLAPSPPLLFMGEEFGATTPFLYFGDFAPDLADLVAEGRRREFSRFPRFADAAERERIPDPGDPATFLRSRLDWREAERDRGRRRIGLYRELLALRRREIVPRFAGRRKGRACSTLIGTGGLRVRWLTEEMEWLEVLVNFSGMALPCPAGKDGRVLFALPALDGRNRTPAELLPLSVVWRLQPRGGQGNG